MPFLLFGNIKKRNVFVREMNKCKDYNIPLSCFSENNVNSERRTGIRQLEITMRSPSQTVRVAATANS